VGRLIAALGGLAMSAACVVPLADKYWTAPEYDDQAIRTLAVLPPKADTTDIRGEPIVREMIYERIGDRGYKTAAPDEIDTVLKEKFGITEPGMIGAATQQELCAAFAADGLLYGTILKWGVTVTGAYNKAEVEARFSVWSCKAEREIWWAQDYADRSTIDVNPASMVGNTLGAVQASYYQLSEEVVYNCMDSLPES